MGTVEGYWGGLRRTVKDDELEAARSETNTQLQEAGNDEVNRATEARDFIAQNEAVIADEREAETRRKKSRASE